MDIKGNLIHSKYLNFYRHKKRRQKFLFVTKIFSLIVFIVLSVNIILAYPFLVKAQMIYNAANNGKMNLERAQEEAAALNFSNAHIFLINAEEDFYKAKLGLEDFEKFYNFPWVGIQLKSLDNLLIASIEITSAVEDVIVLSEDIFEVVKTASLLSGQIEISDQNVTFDSISKEQKEKILQSLYSAPPLLQEAKIKIDAAIDSFNKISKNEVVGPIKNAIEPVAVKLPQLKDGIEKAISAAQIVPQLLGYPGPKTYLFLLQNNSELRPTGGFIGTYGIVKVDTAELETFATDNIYKLDAPAEEFLNTQAPDPIKKYMEVEKWYLRDANWYPDYPASAKKVEELYLKEIDPLLNKDFNESENLWKATIEPQINGVVAVTPEFIKDLLRIVGEINVENQIFNADNLTDILEYQVGRGYTKEDIPEIQRKQIIGKLSQEIKNRLFSLPAKQWPVILEILKNNLDKKHILIYDKDEELQKLLRQNNWDGALIDTDGDYLMVADANMASLKTDQVMERKIYYNLRKDGDDIIGRVKIEYKNQGTFTWKTTRYRTYTRVYVPQGSELLSGEGMMINDRIKDPSRRKGGVDVYNNFNKTVFGAFISIEPGEKRSLTFEYKLPSRVRGLYDKNVYNLYVQKQPGTIGHDLTISLNFDKNIKTWIPVLLNFDFNKKSISFDGNLQKDRAIGIRF